MWRKQMTKLDEEESLILDAFEKGTLKRVADSAEEIERHRRYATATFARDQRITVRVTLQDLRALQKRALADGIPYQALVSSILHKYIEGRLEEHA
jgi:predicted DNA binding CopG/RHH family protein